MKKSWSFALLFSFLILLGSCQFFKKEIPNKDTLIKNELKKVDWSQVDELPSIEYCDSIENTTLRQACFFDYFKVAIEKKLKNDTIQSLYPTLDSLQIKVTVLPDATLNFESDFKNNTPTDLNKSSLDSLLKVKLVNFSPVQPAIKRGIKVKSEFFVPIVLK